MKITKDHLKNLLKAVLGIGLVTYILKTNMVDLDSLKEEILDPMNLLVSFLFFSMTALVISGRWYLLARAQGLSLDFVETVQLTMIGIFFNTFMPGSVGGDLVKAWYVAGKEPKRKTKAVFTVLLDRLIGLSVIIFYAALTLLLFSQVVHERPELKLIAFGLWTFTSTVLILMGLFFSKVAWEQWGVRNLVERLARVKALSKIIEASMLYRSHFKVIVIAIFLSAINVTLVTLLHYFFSLRLGIELDWWVFFFVVPMGLTASAIPILPGGIGVGQVAFFTLFSWVGASNPEQGATLCTIFQAYMILFNCLGAIFYLRHKRKPKDISALETDDFLSEPGFS